MDKHTIFNLKPIAYISAKNGIEIYKIENGHMYCTSNSWNNVANKKFHRLKINENSKGCFITIDGNRYHLNDCISM